MTGLIVLILQLNSMKAVVVIFYYESIVVSLPVTDSQMPHKIEQIKHMTIRKSTI